MSYLTDPGLDPIEREIPVNPADKMAGSFRVTLQPIPVGKYRALCRDLDDKRGQLTKVGTLLDKPIDLDDVTDPDEIEARVLTRSKLNILREKAEEGLYQSLMSLVGWGIIGYSEVNKADGTPYEAKPNLIKWSGFDYQHLDKLSLHLFGKLGLLWHLAFIVMSSQNGQLPDTLEGFYKESDPDPK